MVWLPKHSQLRKAGASKRHPHTEKTLEQRDQKQASRGLQDPEPPEPRERGVQVPPLRAGTARGGL